MKTGLKSPPRARSRSFEETVLQGTIGNPWVVISFSVLQPSLVTGQAGVLSMKIDGLLLADFGTLLSKGGDKTHSEQRKGFTEALAQDVTHLGVNPRSKPTE